MISPSDYSADRRALRRLSGSNTSLAGGACEFSLEYDRGTEVFGALALKLEGYLRLAAG